MIAAAANATSATETATPDPTTPTAANTTAANPAKAADVSDAAQPNGTAATGPAPGGDITADLPPIWAGKHTPADGSDQTDDGASTADATAGTPTTTTPGSGAAPVAAAGTPSLQTDPTVATANPSTAALAIGDQKGGRGNQARLPALPADQNPKQAASELETKSPSADQVRSNPNISVARNATPAAPDSASGSGSGSGSASASATSASSAPDSQAPSNDGTAPAAINSSFAQVFADSTTTHGQTATTAATPTSGQLNSSNAAVAVQTASANLAPLGISASVATQQTGTGTAAGQTAALVSVAGLPVAIAARAHAGASQFDIRLDPPELGRIDVKLGVDSSGQVTSHVTVDRPETLTLLQSQQPQLERALEQAGLRTADNGLQFSLRDQSFAGGNNGGGNQPAAAPASQLVIPDADLTPVASQIYSRWGLGSGIDIRV